MVEKKLCMCGRKKLLFVYLIFWNLMLPAAGSEPTLTVVDSYGSKEVRTCLDWVGKPPIAAILLLAICCRASALVTTWPAQNAAAAGAASVSFATGVAADFFPLRGAMMKKKVEMFFKLRIGLNWWALTVLALLL